MDLENYRIDPSKGMKFGIYTLGDHLPDPQKRSSIQSMPTTEFFNAAESTQRALEEVYLHEMFGHERHIAQINFGGVPFERLERNIELNATEILPAVKKYIKN